jgi:hypothetical protein
VCFCKLHSVVLKPLVSGYECVARRLFEDENRYLFCFHITMVTGDIYTFVCVCVCVFGMYYNHKYSVVQVEITDAHTKHI